MTALIIEPQTKDDYYALLTPKERELSKNLGEAFFNSSRRSVEAIKEAGDALIKAKKSLKNKFMYFCKYELPLDCSQDTIEGFMRLATIINERPALAKYNPTVIFELSRRSTPVEVVEEMESLAELDQHKEVKVKEVKGKIAEAKKQTVTIKKGDIVEWQFDVKGYTFGRVTRKSSDGITCRIESLHGKNLGEKATKLLNLCPVQTLHEGIVDTQALQLETGQKVIVSPYATYSQNLSGMTGVIIIRNPNRRSFTVRIGEIVRDFFWEELRLPKEEPTPPPTKEESNNFIDVDAQVVNETPSLPEAPQKIGTSSLPESPLTIDLKNLGWSQKRQLLKELIKELQLGTALPKSEIEEALDQLVERTLQELDGILGSSLKVREQFLIALVDKCL